MKKLCEPMVVTPPPPCVPRFNVTNSRTTLSSPIVSDVVSPWYFRSCGGLPMEAWPKNWFRSPMAVGPSMRVYGPTMVPAPMVTCAPISAYAPISTSSASLASSLTIAVGWIRGISY